MEAASHQFISLGMNQASMQSIADQAGVSKLTVYNHYGNKAELFRQIITHKCELHLNEALFAEARTLPLAQGLYNIGYAFVELIFSPEALNVHRTVMSESRHNQEIADIFYQSGPQRVLNAFISYLEEVVDSKRLQAVGSSRLAELFFALFTGDTFMQAALRINPPPSQAEIEIFTRENVSFFMQLVDC